MNIAAKRGSSALNRSARRLWAAACLAAFALSGPAPAAARSAHADTIYVHYWTRATPLGSTTLCQGDVLKIRTSVAVNVSRGGGQRYAPYELTPGMYGAQINAGVQNGAVGSVFPASRPTGTAGGQAVANFAFTAGKPGRTTIVFEYVPSQEDALAPLVPEGEDELAPLVAPLRIRHLSPTPASLSVEVKQCSYRITVVSGWVLAGERSTTATGYLTATVTPDQNGTFNTQATMRNNATASGGCTGSVTVGNSQANISGRITGQRLGTRLEVDITYATVHSSSRESCVGKGTTDTATPDPLHIVMPVSGGNISMNHFMPGTKPVDGVSFIMIRRLTP